MRYVLDVGIAGQRHMISVFEKKTRRKITKMQQKNGMGSEKMSDIGEFLVATFPNYTMEMWEGNVPCGRGHELVRGGFTDRWKTKWGGGETDGDEIHFFEFNVNPKVCIFICGDLLNISEIRHYGKHDQWCYCNKPGHEIWGTSLKKYQHPLEPEKVEKYLNTKIPNCKVWDMVQARAKELFYSGGRRDEEGR